MLLYSFLGAGISFLADLVFHGLPTIMCFMAEDLVFLGPFSTFVGLLSADFLVPKNVPVNRIKSFFKGLVDFGSLIFCFVAGFLTVANVGI